jgi:hypothetical protein
MLVTRLREPWLSVLRQALVLLIADHQGRDLPDRVPASGDRRPTFTPVALSDPRIEIRAAGGDAGWSERRPTRGATGRGGRGLAHVPGIG